MAIESFASSGQCVYLTINIFDQPRFRSLSGTWQPMASKRIFTEFHVITVERLMSLVYKPIDLY